MKQVVELGDKTRHLDGADSGSVHAAIVLLALEEQKVEVAKQKRFGQHWVLRTSIED